MQDGVIDRFKRAHGDFLEGQYRREHSFQAGWLTQPGTEIDDIPGEFDLDNLWFQGSSPLPVDDDAFAWIGLRYEHRRLNRNAMFALLDQDETLTVGHLATGAGLFATPDWLLAAYAGFGVASDFDAALTRDDYRLQGRLIASHRFSPSLFLRFGADGSETDGRARIIPLVGGAWQIAERVRVDALLPKWLLVTWEAAVGVYVAAGYEITGEEYRRRDAAGVDSDLRNDEYRFYVEARWHVIEKAGLWLRVGLCTGAWELETPTVTVSEWQELAPYVEAGISFDLF
jgi:hypothetical protein